MWVTPPSIQGELRHLALKKLRPAAISHLENAATKLFEAGERKGWSLGELIYMRLSYMKLFALLNCDKVYGT